MSSFTINGSEIELSEGRAVFYGTHEGHHYFRFRNREGVETKLKLSAEANDALIQLIIKPKEISRWVLKLRSATGASWEHAVETVTSNSEWVHLGQEEVKP